MIAARVHVGGVWRRTRSKAQYAIVPAALLTMFGLRPTSKHSADFSVPSTQTIPQHPTAITTAERVQIHTGYVGSGRQALAPHDTMTQSNFTGAGFIASAVAIVAALTQRTSVARRTASIDCPQEADVKDSEENRKWFARVSLLIMAMLCSTNFSLLKILENGQSEAAVAAARFAVAALPFLPMARNHLDHLSMRSGMEIGLWCFVGDFSQAVGLQTTEASHGAFLCSLCMVVVPIAKVLMGERVPTQIWASVILAVFGTAMLIGVGAPSGFHEGDIFCSITALGFGIMFLRMDMYAREPGFNAVGCTVWQLLTLAVCTSAWLVCSTGPSAAADEVMSVITSRPEVLPILLWVGLVTTAGVLYAETVAMKEIDGTEAGIIFTTEPVWATLFSSMVLGESFGTSEGIGAVLIIISCLLTQVNLESTEQRKPIETI